MLIISTASACVPLSDSRLHLPVNCLYAWSSTMVRSSCVGAGALGEKRAKLASKLSTALASDNIVIV